MSKTELVSKKDLWNKITIENLEDRKEFSTFIVTPQCDATTGYTIPGGGGCTKFGAGVYNGDPLNSNIPAWVPC